MALERGTVGPLTTTRRWAALGLVVGPAAFIGGWVVGGATMDGYSPIDDAISRIAAVGAPNRALMTTAFVTYGVAVMVGSTALRSSPLRRAWWLAAVNGAATIAVAALPLERSDAIDSLHGVAAGIGYASIAALPLVAAGPLRSMGRHRAAALSIAGGTISALCLAATTVTEANGFFQRLGLSVGDVWLVATGLTLWRASRPEA